MTYFLSPGSIPLGQQNQLDATKCSKAGAWGQGDYILVIYKQQLYKTAVEMLLKGFGVTLKLLLYS